MKRQSVVKIASLATLGMVPMLFWSQDSQAIPAFARKYQTSCYTCHAGFPARNAFGEAFKANGYRWPGGEDEDHAKQEQTKMGSDGWKKSFPSSPWPTDIPGFAPVAIFVTGPLFNYADEIKYKSGAKNGQVKTGQVADWAGPFDARILYGGTIGSNIGFFGSFEGFAAGNNNKVSANNIVARFRGTWTFTPGLMLSVGNQFSFMSSGEDEATWSAILPPSNGAGVELAYATGEKSGGFRFYAGAVSNGTDQALNSSTTNGLDDIKYARAEFKIGGAGVLSGAGGTYGNEYIGLDNSLEIGASVVNALPGIFSSSSYGYKNNRTVYGVDIAGNYGSFTGGAAWSRGVDNDLNNYQVDAGYFVYPWLKAAVTYKSVETWGSDGVHAGNSNITNPTYTFTVTAWPRANVSFAAAYVLFEKGNNPVADANGIFNNANTFKFTTALAF
ncbi:MAG: hypothetical protein FDX30_12135 [Chlorobium sp.]|nr:MAG: hypothetical protein FDX30_12135 [Chlorobium sp.]